MQKLLAMKLTFILIFGCLLQASANFAQQVNVKAVNMPLTEFFSVVEKQTGYVFFYATSDIRQAKPVTISLENVMLDRALTEVMKTQPLTYTIEGKAIFIKPATKKIEVTEEPVPPPVIDVTGKVTDETGKPVAGASVTVKGVTGKGVATDEKGNFILKGIDENAVIVISGVSIETQEIKLSGRKELVVYATTKLAELDEVIVNKGYYTEKQRFSVGNVGSVFSKEISNQPVMNPLSAIQSKLSGVNVVQTTGLAGGSFKVQIRGQNSIRNTDGNENDGTNANNPLYIIDGVPYLSRNILTGPSRGSSTSPFPASYLGTNPLSSINPSDIESIEVLKDADATAIYGSRGANGVILITTKKGKAGSVRLTADYYSGFGQVTRKMKLLNTDQYLEMRKEAIKNDGLTGPAATPFDITGNWLTRSTDWQEELIGGTARTMDAQINISGGSTINQFRFGGGYHKETSVFPGNFSDQRGSAHVSLTNLSENKKFRSNITINYSSEKNTLPIKDLTKDALNRPPNAPKITKANGEINWEEANLSLNPLQYIRQPFVSKTNALISQAGLSYEVFKGVILSSSFGLTNVEKNEMTKLPISSYAPGSVGALNTTHFGGANVKSWIVEPQMNWNKIIYRSNISVLLGSTFQEEVQRGVSQTARGFTNEALMEDVGAVLAANVTSTSNYFKYRYTALFGRISYKFDNKYLINLTGRRDGSSRFGSENKFGNFGAVGAGWIFSDENFIKKHLPILTFGKIRGSFGLTGSDQIPNYAYLNAYRSDGQYQNIPGLSPSRLQNPGYSWESVQKTEGAIELGFWKNRLVLTSVYYQNRSSNQLVGLPLPPTTGFSDITANRNATVQNSGWEIDLRTTNFKNRSFVWKSAINLSVPKTKLIKYEKIETSVYANLYLVGYPMSISRLYNYVGVDPQTGLYLVKDVDGNNTFNTRDRTFVGDRSPKFFGGFQNSFHYKGIDIDFSFQFFKQQGRNYLVSFLTLPGRNGNQPTEVLNRWRKPGDISNIQKFTTGSSTSYSLASSSSFSLADASYIRLKNLSISYNLPEKINKRIHTQSVRFFLIGQNLFTITKYKGLDPESLGDNLPPLRTWAGGLSMTL